MVIGISILYIVLYWLLLRWTASLYSNWKSSIPQLLLQLSLFALSMLIAYAINQDGGDFFRPMGVFSGIGEEEWTTLPTYIPTYTKRFVDIVIMQYLAIRFKRFLIRKKVHNPEEETER